MYSEDVIKKYDMVFQKFLARNIGRRKMDSMIYGVSIYAKRGVDYVPPKHSRVKPNPKQKNTKPKALYSHFTYGHTHDYAAQKSQVKKNFGRTRKKGSKKILVPNDKIIYAAYILSGRVETPDLISGLWMLMAHDWKKAYVPKSGT